MPAVKKKPVAKTAAKGKGDWFHKKSPAAQKAYIAKHPTSIYAKQAKKLTAVDARKARGVAGKPNEDAAHDIAEGKRLVRLYTQKMKDAKTPKAKESAKAELAKYKKELATDIAKQKTGKPAKKTGTTKVAAKAPAAGRATSRAKDRISSLNVQLKRVAADIKSNRAGLQKAKQALKESNAAAKKRGKPTVSTNNRIKAFTADIKKWKAVYDKLKEKKAKLV